MTEYHKDPLSLGVIMSEQCNLNCGYCSMDKKSKEKIDVNEFMESYNSLKTDNKERSIKLNFFGGEPLIQFKMIKSIINRTKGDNVTYSIPTNGLSLTKEVVDFINKENISVSISYDGLWQDKNRKLMSGDGSNSSLSRKFKLIGKIKSIKSHTMVGVGNYNLLENWLYIKEVLNINTELTLIRDIGTWDKDSVSKLIGGIDELFSWYEESDRSDMPQFLLFYLRHFLLYEMKGITVNSCGAGNDTMFYSKDKLTPCVRFEKDPKYLEYIEGYTGMPGCETCSVKSYCRKGCMFEQIKNGAPIDELCTVYRYIYKRISVMTKTLMDDKNFLDIVRMELSSEK